MRTFRLKITAILAVMCLLTLTPCSFGQDAERTGDSLSSLPLRRTSELTHVDSKRFAAALNKDPDRIFQFVRDRVRFESYTGVLRGSRGTLMALAGNSADQSILLSSMLKHAGFRVRFVRGKLPAEKARKLVKSIWAVQPRSNSAKQPSSPMFERTLKKLQSYVRRDYGLIREQLQKVGIRPKGAVRFDFDSLVAETQEHVWVRVYRDGKWIDLDPTLTEAVPGKVYAKEETLLNQLPETMFHHIEIRIRVEEYNGTTRSERTLLSVQTRAEKLSGKDIVLLHQPEKWTGPANTLQGAFAAITDTGRIKPVLVVGREKWKSGKPFREKPPTQRGIGGIFNQLSGIGTRNSVPIATALWIEFTFVSPDRRKRTVVREIFDRIGQVRRQKKKSLTASEIRTRIQIGGEAAVAHAVYSLFITTGHINASHLPASVSKKTPKSEKHPRIDTVLRRVHIAYTAAADALTRRMHTVRKTAVRCYPDSPRVYIAELSKRGDSFRFTYDLRHDPARAVSIDSRPEDLFHGRILRGVITGTLERMVLDLLTIGAGGSRAKGFSPVMTTSHVFDNVKRGGALLLFSKGLEDRTAIPGDAYIRVKRALRNNRLVLIPLKGTNGRIAWWEIDPHTGTTIAVTDNGLHGASMSYSLRIRRSVDGVFIVLVNLGGTTIWMTTFRSLARLQEWLRKLAELGIYSGPFGV